MKVEIQDQDINVDEINYETDSKKYSIQKI
jgi:hypothetical protein